MVYTPTCSFDAVLDWRYYIISRVSLNISQHFEKCKITSKVSNWNSYHMENTPFTLYFLQIASNAFGKMPFPTF